MQSSKKRTVIMFAIGTLLGAAASVAFVANAQQAPKPVVPSVSQAAPAQDGNADSEVNDGPDTADVKEADVVGASATAEKADAAGNKDDSDPADSDVTAGGKDSARDGQDTHEAQGGDGDGDGETNDDAASAAK